MDPEGPAPAAPATTPESFVSWLPTWYDAVLSLLTEERRQSLAVFGPELAPEMMSKVLSECFRPILGSFQTRLESVLRPSASKTTGAGSLENICALYEATLQFLTLAYEAVAGSWHDVADATTSASGVKLYQSITGVILQVASPFLVYQQHLGELEGQHSTVAQQLIAKDIRQAVSISNPNTVSMLQDATERLKGLAPFIFPLTEAAVVRLELLTG
eukprot:CAMPEP_0116867404 /NCGR_PEP_ID=MMETSP0418-20121206/26602_1 /TAXON_ID=1158023 /ORGANISM="Astrosyne radiata, Strain 13vi08-1A" /LENGTH=215 /DNA_ID=CAMNT_0004503219 /DNA_START=168 /DNA_END=812 /DNA_ORIENTATION=-